VPASKGKARGGGHQTYQKVSLAVNGKADRTSKKGAVSSLGRPAQHEPRKEGKNRQSQNCGDLGRVPWGKEKSEEKKSAIPAPDQEEKKKTATTPVAVAEKKSPLAVRHLIEVREASPKKKRDHCSEKRPRPLKLAKKEV